ncbi:protein of unknown function [Shewanella benthica]|uniref:Uncharacterized protein n=1 Tax=Shewanella benthica TaxID=43661 RepID=A0A330M675_9GAMM|nr:protein of unknown function [Shewanella benthica]
MLPTLARITKANQLELSSFSNATSKTSDPPGNKVAARNAALNINHNSVIKAYLMKKRNFL